MELRGKLAFLSRELRLLVAVFVITLNVGFFTGINFVKVTTSFKAAGIQSNYLGNEEDEEAEVMKFKKTEREILTLVHNHILSLSIVFFLLALLLHMTGLQEPWRSFLMLEPFLSLVLTFGGIYVLWLGVTWFKYVIMLSGLLMVASIVISSLVLLKECFFPLKPKH